MYNKNDIITLEDNKKYLVVENINIDNNYYLLLTDYEDDKSDIAIVKVINTTDNTYLDNIDDEEEYTKVLNKMTLMYKDEINLLLNNINKG